MGVKISALAVAGTIDGAADYFAIVSSGTTKKISRATFLGISGSPVGTSDVQVLTGKTLTSPTITNPTITGTIAGGATIASPTITGATISSPSITGTVTGAATYSAPTITGPSITGTVSGGATYTAPTITGPTISGTVAGSATYTTPTLTTPTLNSPVVRSWDGWQDANESWTFLSATTITVPTDATTKYSVGDRIKLTQTTVKYFYIVGVAATVLTITGGSDYTLVNASISSNYYSKMASPLGFPGYFAYAPTIVGFSANPTLNSYFRITARTVDLWITTVALGTSNSSSFSYSLPVTAASISSGQLFSTPIRAYNSSVLSTTIDYAFISSGATTVTLAHSDGASSWTGSGTKGASLQISYVI